MFFFSSKSLTSKNYRHAIEYAKRPDGIRLLLTLVLGALFVFIVSWHFEYKYLNILSNTSMVDETKTLTFLEKKAIKDTSSQIYKDWGLPVRFKLTTEELSVPFFEKPTLYININPEKPDVLIFTPSGMGKIRDNVQDNLLTCLKDKTKSTGTCLNEALLYFIDFVQ